MNDEEDALDGYRFGFTPAQIVAEIMTHRGVIREGSYVPTHREVATWPAERLWSVMLGWWRESPLSLIPNDAQVAESVAVLRARSDAHSAEIQKIIAQAPPPSDSDSEKVSRAEDGSNEREGEGD